MGILSGNSANEPLHVGEITRIWAYLLSTNGLLRLYETFINHAGDTELKREIQDLMRTMQDETKQLSKLLKENGVALPPTTPERPLANAEDIPVGGRLLDPEIASTVGMNLGQGMVSCSMVMGQCLREDVALIVWSVSRFKSSRGHEVASNDEGKGRGHCTTTLSSNDTFYKINASIKIIQLDGLFFMKLK